MSIGFGIIGCGMIANFHAKALNDAPGVELVACCARDLEKAKAFGEPLGIACYGSVEEMLADPKVAAVSIATPSGAHMEPALLAAEAGKHVVVEKPLEVTLERCDKIIDACDKAGVKLGVTLQSRFHKSSQLIKQAVDGGRFGTITMGDAYVKWFRTQEYYDSGAWRGTWELDGGGALMNQAIHTVDLLTWMMGPVTEVTACTGTLAHERIEVEDVAVATVRFESGALGVIEASTAAFPGSLKRIEISGTIGTAVLEEEDIKTWEFAEMTDEDRRVQEEMIGKNKTGGGAADPAAIGHHGHTAVFTDVAQAIESGETPLVDGREGRRSVEIILAIYKASQEKRSVSLPLG
ncbi:Putative 4,5-dihydroxyphthalate dehydrogenase [Rosistilla carotiformis]|uniref:4,5-dihydroxyphthalate dehydrogenase n=1 Tax=Rosistilla carotiformis TaxID=2528017 RepID=A0A518JPR8_9BACT|nr:Gfo/Idh/MocA family oxidoreductase [Rosistilla carotiformis]QDV67539.1 Putative 4,5-dihydroxyphthalate dehydrogenase [Rosistilla carotiformis]